MLRTGKISKEWNSGLAYVIGLITSDGNLSPDGRHISITSKDESMLQAVASILKIGNKITKKSRGSSMEKKYSVLEFGSVDFYKFLLSIGLTPAKSRTLGPLNIPEECFAEFLRGCIDGDGSVVETTHLESSHLQLRVSVCSASILFLEWLHDCIRGYFGISGGWIYTSPDASYSLLNYGKEDSIEVLRKIYTNSDLYRLERKYSVALKYLDESAIICNTV